MAQPINVGENESIVLAAKTTPDILSDEVALLAKAAQQLDIQCFSPAGLDTQTLDELHATLSQYTDQRAKLLCQSDDGLSVDEQRHLVNVLGSLLPLLVKGK